MLNAYAYVHVCFGFFFHFFLLLFLSFGSLADLFVVNFRFYARQTISVRGRFFFEFIFSFLTSVYHSGFSLLWLLLSVQQT